MAVFTGLLELEAVFLGALRLDGRVGVAGDVGVALGTTQPSVSMHRALESLRVNADIQRLATGQIHRLVWALVAGKADLIGHFATLDKWRGRALCRLDAGGLAGKDCHPNKHKCHYEQCQPEEPGLVVSCSHHTCAPIKKEFLRRSEVPGTGGRLRMNNKINYT
jgi:hypothetical protein